MSLKVGIAIFYKCNQKIFLSHPQLPVETTSHSTSHRSQQSPLLQENVQFSVLIL